jgi:hypothetical protein
MKPEEGTMRPEIRSRLSQPSKKIDRFDNLEAEAGNNTLIIKQVITIVMHRNELHAPVRTSGIRTNLTRHQEALPDSIFA